MKLIIDNRSGQPIYDQIYNQLRDQIINGTLAEDESLPSIRTLAKDPFQAKEVLWQERMSNSFKNKIFASLKNI